MLIIMYILQVLKSKVESLIRLLLVIAWFCISLRSDYILYWQMSGQFHISFSIQSCEVKFFYRLVLVSRKRRKEMNLFVCLWMLMGRNLFLEHCSLRSCLSNNLTWCLTEILSYHTTGKMELSTSMDTGPITLLNILWIVFYWFKAISSY